MISIVILTYDRQDILLENLKIIDKLSCSDKEIIVVDNGNSKQTKNLLKKYHQDCIYIGVPINSPCDARNRGIKTAQGKIVVTLDDDVMFTDVDALNTIELIFSKNPDVSVVNFKIVFEDSFSIIPFNWYHPRDYRFYGDTEFETDYISEGAVAFRRDIFHKTGYYPTEFFMSHEGPDLAYRILDAGYKMIYSPRIEVVHKVSPIQRTSWRNSYYDTRNQIWLGVRNLKWPEMVFHLVYRLITTFLFSIFRGHLKWYVKAIRDAVIEVPRELNYRRPISKETSKRLREIRKFKPSLLDKVRDFAEKIRLVQKHYT